MWTCDDFEVCAEVRIIRKYLGYIPFSFSWEKLSVERELYNRESRIGPTTQFGVAAPTYAVFYALFYVVSNVMRVLWWFGFLFVLCEQLNDPTDSFLPNVPNSSLLPQATINDYKLWNDEKYFSSETFFDFSNFSNEFFENIFYTHYWGHED